MKLPKVKVVDFFSGCGGTSAGLQEAGMEILAGIDIDEDSADSFGRNFPGANVFRTNILDLDTKVIEGLLPRRDYVLFAGCAPCQPFSKQQKNRITTDPRRTLLLEFLRFILDLRPEFVLVENVPGIQSVEPGSGPFDKFVRSLKAEGYSIDYGVLTAAEFGVPQVRKRLVLVASLVSEVRLPPRTHGDDLESFSSVRDWIGHLPPIDAGARSTSDRDHSSMKLSPINLERIRATPEGGGRADWPPRLRLKCHSEYNGHSDVYGRLSWDRPASGLTTRCISYSNGRFGHPEQDRAISVREAALLQTFPRDFQFAGTLTSRARQIGNAVPPLVARRTGEALVQSLAI